MPQSLTPRLALQILIEALQAELSSIMHRGERQEIALELDAARARLAALD